MKIFAALMLVTMGFLSGCATTPPSNPNNICDIFEDEPDWYKAAKKSEGKWGSSVPIMMSMMYQESQFVQKARPARTKILWIFPGPRPSNAYFEVEAFAEVLHEKVRKEYWGYATDEHLTNEELIKESYLGIRPAPGYPACPDHTEKHKLFNLLGGNCSTHAAAILEAGGVLWSSFWNWLEVPVPLTSKLFGIL